MVSELSIEVVFIIWSTVFAERLNSCFFGGYLIIEHMMK